MDTVNGMHMHHPMWLIWAIFIPSHLLVLETPEILKILTMVKEVGMVIIDNNTHLPQWHLSEGVSSEFVDAMPSPLMMLQLWDRGRAAIRMAEETMAEAENAAVLLDLWNWQDQ